MASSGIDQHTQNERIIVSEALSPSYGNIWSWTEEGLFIDMTHLHYYLWFQPTHLWIQFESEHCDQYVGATQTVQYRASRWDQV